MKYKRILWKHIKNIGDKTGKIKWRMVNEKAKVCVQTKGKRYLPYEAKSARMKKDYKTMAIKGVRTDD